MIHPKKISIAAYTYSLPEERIAKYPLKERDESKLLIYNKGEITEDIYKNISSHIPGNSLFVFNNTKVIEARLLFQKPTGGTIEIFCLEPHEQYPDITNAMMQKEKVRWLCMIGGASKWKHQQVLEKKIFSKGKELTVTATFIEKRPGSFVIEFSWIPQNLSFAEILHHAGAIPLPPYIKRKTETEDAERYQTVYARHNGSVAAPTAGLHFTENIFKSFAQKNILKDFVTLHVGAGTFKPVKSETMEQHEMHTEHFDVSKGTIENIISHVNNIIAVGTTSLRTIESLYWLGVKLALSEHKSPSGNISFLPELDQWECYDITEQNLSVTKSLQVLLDWMEKNKKEKLYAKTQIIIAPGYRFRIVKGLVTNFHQPQSTLLLLIAAFIGENWKEVYNYAMQNDFRFLSYGDGCLLWPDVNN